MRILVVEDDEKISSFIVKGLQQEGMVVDRVPDGAEGLTMASGGVYDAAIIDVMLPKMDGLTLIRKLRDQGIRTPVLILSAKRSVDDRVAGLKTGGDDYLVKPFAFSELVARLQALVRRSNNILETGKFVVGDLSLDLLSREVRRNEQRIDLQPREYTLLEYLMRNAGRILSKTMILEHVWDYSFDPQTNVVDVLVCRLRNKIDRDHREKLLHTIRGVGYVLKRD